MISRLSLIRISILSLVLLMMLKSSEDTGWPVVEEGL